MFKFLKNKLKGALDKFSKKVEDAPEEEVKVEKEVLVEDVPKPPVKKKSEQKSEKPKKSEEKKEHEREEVETKVKKEFEKKEKVKVEEKKEPVREVVEKAEGPEVKREPVEEAAESKPLEEKSVEKKGFFSKIKESFGGESKGEEVRPELETETPKVEEPGKKGFFKKITETITTKKISPEQFDSLFWDLELALLENNVAIEVIEKIKNDLKTRLIEKPVPRSQVTKVISDSLQESIEELFVVPDVDLVKMAKEKKPLVVCFVGINGSGKTTSIAKIARYLLDNNLSIVLAAADTFRAAAIDQLQLHADKLGVKLIRHDYGSDPAAVAFDAVRHAESAGKDVVLIDTAGRLHSNINLVDEMKKIVRVAKPDLKIFVGESITGNDCVEQAMKFDQAVGIDGIVLSKADVDEKGGAAISISYVTKKPILFLGVGQEYKDLQEFNREKLLASIGL